MRGPKKKKGGGGGEGVIESTDIVNIFKDRADPEITYIQHYPIYVQELSLGTHTFHEHLLGVMHDIDALVVLQRGRNPTGPTTTGSSRPSSGREPRDSTSTGTSTASPIL